jgi:hypothetical protein
VSSLPGRGELIAALRDVEAWGDRRAWQGTDPYDGLNATRFVGPLRRFRRGRQAITQLVKRSPVDLRSLLGIPPGRSSAALAHVVSSYVLNGFLPAGERERKLLRTLELLLAARCEGYDDACWGYHFDVQTRVFFYPRGAPNTIATSFAALALLDAYESTGDEELLETASSAARFFLRHVPLTEGREGAYFGYLVGDRTPIHNANLLACAVLARVSAATGDERMRTAADAGVRYTVAHQRRDGSWPYAERSGLRWVDGFHTGYVLDCLHVCRVHGLESAREETLVRGLAYYGSRLFLPDGTPKYTDTSVHPIDIQCAAQAIQTFSVAGLADPSQGELAARVYRFALERMRRSDGAFIFQRRRLWTNRAAHVRWAQAPMLLALTHLLRLSDGLA